MTFYVTQSVVSKTESYPFPTYWHASIDIVWWLDTDGVLLPRAMKVHSIEWVADGAAKFIQDKGAPSSRPCALWLSAPGCSLALVAALLLMTYDLREHRSKHYMQR